MASGGPGGREVGRLSVRVVPNTSGFKERLTTFLKKVEQGAKVNVGVELDTTRAMAEARRTVSRIDGQTASLNVRANTTRAFSEGETVRRRLDGLVARMAIEADPRKALAEYDRLVARARDLRVELKIDADTAGALTKVRALRTELDRFDRRGKGLGSFGGLSGVFDSLFSAGSKLPGLLGTIAGGLGTGAETGLKFGSSLQEALGSATGFAGSLGKVAGPLAAVGSAVVGALGAVVGLGAQFALLAVVAGAATFALGAVGAALGALPALVGVAAGVLAPIALGLDGIKKAAQSIKPQFDAMKASVSEVFQRGLTPVLQNLARNLFPTLTKELQKSALQLVDIADGMGRFLASAQGLQFVRTLFQGSRDAITAMLPGLQQLGYGFLNLTGQTPLFALLGQTIGGIAGKVGELLTRLSQGGLAVQAFTQLRDVLLAAADIMVRLVAGATEFFTAAGPGVVSLLQSIGQVVAQIDFKGLGESFGIFARAVGTFISSIPPGFWEKLATSVRELALKFSELANDPSIQSFFLFLIAQIPVAIDGFTAFLGAVRALANTFANAWDGMKLAVLVGVQAILSGLLTVAIGVNTLVQAMPFLPQSFKDAAAGAVTALGGMKDGVGRELDATKQTLYDRGHQMGEGGNAVGRAVADGAKRGVAPLPENLSAKAKEAANRVGAQQGAHNAAGNRIGVAGQQGATRGIAPMPNNMGRTASDAKGRVESQAPGFNSAGGSLASGLARGIRAGASAVISAAISIARSALNAAKRALGIHSPSTVFRDQIGAMIPRGVGVGVLAQVPVAVSAVGALVDRLVATSTAQSPRITAAMAAGIDLKALGRTQASDYTAAFAGVPAEVAKATAAVSTAHASVSVEAEEVRAAREAERDERVAAALAAHLAGGLRLDTEQGEVIARLARRGENRLAGRGVRP